MPASEFPAKQFAAQAKVANTAAAVAKNSLAMTIPCSMERAKLNVVVDLEL
jgi:hypothetical protein